MGNIWSYIYLFSLLLGEDYGGRHVISSKYNLEKSVRSAFLGSFKKNMKFYFFAASAWA